MVHKKKKYDILSSRALLRFLIFNYEWCTSFLNNPMNTDSMLWGVAAPTRQRSEHRVRLGVAAAARGAAGRRAGRDARGPRPPWRRLSTHTTRADIMIWRQSEYIPPWYTIVLPTPPVVRSNEFLKPLMHDWTINGARYIHACVASGLAPRTAG